MQQGIRTKVYLVVDAHEMPIKSGTDTMYRSLV